MTRLLSAFPRETLETRTMGAFAGTFERASFPACRRAGAWMGLAFYAALKHRRRVAIANLQTSLNVSEVRANHLARKSAQNFAMTFCEFLRLRTATEREIRNNVPKPA